MITASITMAGGDPRGTARGAPQRATKTGISIVEERLCMHIARSDRQLFDSLTASQRLPPKYEYEYIGLMEQRSGGKKEGRTAHVRKRGEQSGGAGRGIKSRT